MINSFKYIFISTQCRWGADNSDWAECPYLREQPAGQPSDRLHSSRFGGWLIYKKYNRSYQWELPEGAQMRHITLFSNLVELQVLSTCFRDRFKVSLLGMWAEMPSPTHFLWGGIVTSPRLIVQSSCCARTGESPGVPQVEHGFVFMKQSWDVLSSPAVGFFFVYHTQYSFPHPSFREK